MDKIPMLATDTYMVINKTTLHDSDRKILIMLYQPIIGSLAINLYFTLWSYLDKNEIISMDWTHHHLMTSMQINMEKIIESREKLEAIGLLKTYMKENKETNINSYIYEMYSPLRVYDFLKDPILSTILQDSVGKLEYKKIIEYFQLPTYSLKEYKDISSNFNDIFMTTSSTNETVVEDIRRVNKLGIIYEPTIDLNSILGMIPKEMLNLRSVNNNIKDLIYKLALVYNYDDKQMLDLIMNSIDETHKINDKTLKTNARTLYKFENDNKGTSLIYKNQPEYLRTKTTSTSRKAKMIYTFETTSPYDFLAIKNGCKPTKEEASILEYLLVDINLPTGVVNVLIDYILNVSDNKLIKSFVYNKATEWKRNNIETVEDAMNMAKKEKTTKKTTTKKAATAPEWFNKKIDKEEASKEEQKAFIEKLKNME